jgi:predicted RNA-binding Zn ribbon-like protein
MGTLELIEAFVNTADLEDGTDVLADAPGLVGWLADRGLLEGPTYATNGDAAHARAVREAVRELLRANNGLEVDRDHASETLDQAARRAGLSVRFVEGTMRFVPTRGGVDAGVARVLAAVGEAMYDGSWRKLKACRSDTCRWAFVDHARNQSRHWCDMAVCGNRAKARTFRERHHA